KSGAGCATEGNIHVHVHQRLWTHVPAQCKDDRIPCWDIHVDVYRDRRSDSAHGQLCRQLGTTKFLKKFAQPGRPKPGLCAIPSSWLGPDFGAARDRTRRSSVLSWVDRPRLLAIPKGDKSIFHLRYLKNVEKAAISCVFEVGS